jgi:hypothetical protein
MLFLSLFACNNPQHVDTASWTAGNVAIRLAETDGLVVETATLRVDEVSVHDCFDGELMDEWEATTVDLESDSLRLRPGQWCEVKYQLTMLLVEGTWQDEPLSIAWDLREIEFEEGGPAVVNGNDFVAEVGFKGWFKPTDNTGPFDANHADADVLTARCETPQPCGRTRTETAS